MPVFLSLLKIDFKSPNFLYLKCFINSKNHSSDLHAQGKQNYTIHLVYDDYYTTEELANTPSGTQPYHTDIS